MSVRDRIGIILFLTGLLQPIELSSSSITLWISFICGFNTVLEETNMPWLQQPIFHSSKGRTKYEDNEIITKIRWF